MKLKELKLLIISNFLEPFIDEGTKWVLNDNLTVDVYGSVNFHPFKKYKFPFKFGKVHGYFNCNYTYIDSLKNCPDYVETYFGCSHCKLTSIEFAPKKVGTFYCNDNPVKFTEEDVKKVCEVSGRIFV